MGARRFLVCTAVAVLAAVLTATTSVTGQTTGSMTPRAPDAIRPVAAATDLAPVAPGAGLMVPLQEFRTSRNAGWFYTLSTAEAASAVQKLKFTRQGTVGAMYLKPVAGATAVHRLRVKVGDPSYLLSISPVEIADPRFVDEGVVGWVARAPKPGLVRLMRFSNHSQWRVSVESLANAQKAAGYTVDGTLGWVRP